MAKTPREGDNTEQAVYLKHQAIAILDAEKAEELKKIRKRHRKDAELAGVPLGDMDWAIKTMGMPVGEIRKFFTEKLKLLGFNGVNIGKDVVEKMIGDQSEDRTYEGRLAGMQGKACSPPANFTPNERQTWIAGWHEGDRARQEAQAESEAEEAAAREAAAARRPDESTDAAQNLGGDDYGGDDDAAGRDVFEASEEELAAQTGRPSTQEAEATEEAPLHQPPKKSRAKKAGEAVH